MLMALLIQPSKGESRALSPRERAVYRQTGETAYGDPLVKESWPSRILIRKSPAWPTHHHEASAVLQRESVPVLLNPAKPIKLQNFLGRSLWEGPSLDENTNDKKSKTTGWIVFVVTHNAKCLGLSLAAGAVVFCSGLWEAVKNQR